MVRVRENISGVDEIRALLFRADNMFIREMSFERVQKIFQSIAIITCIFS